MLNNTLLNNKCIKYEITGEINGAKSWFFEKFNKADRFWLDEL